MIKFLKFVYGMIILISLFFAVRDVSAAPPVYCIEDEDCYDLCTSPLVEICTNYQCICLKRF
ncbi:putative Late nodulin [Medicago truncatula]|uniref:Putative Late nodulin n=1 Tax=Medicago truncatula TaxID=3880 RepID=A0A396GL70_MEDTR|nr:putative Late nodulin [Medicago truncatula]